MRAIDYFRNIFKKDKQITTSPTKEDDGKSEIDYEDVYTHAFDRPSRKKFVGTHRETKKKFKKMKFKEEKITNEEEFSK